MKRPLLLQELTSAFASTLKTIHKAITRAEAANCQLACPNPSGKNHRLVDFAIGEYGLTDTCFVCECGVMFHVQDANLEKP